MPWEVRELGRILLAREPARTDPGPQVPWRRQTPPTSKTVAEATDSHQDGMPRLHVRQAADDFTRRDRLLRDPDAVARRCHRQRNSDTVTAQIQMPAAEGFG